MTKNTVRHVLLELERAGWDSLCNQTGSEYYGELMLPNALMVLANGHSDQGLQDIHDGHRHDRF